MKPYRRHGLTAWLAMAALWLCLLAPTVSRSLQAADAMAMPGATPACAMHGHDNQHQGGLPRPGMPSEHGDACGYCGLLGHSPGLTFHFASPRIAVMAPAQLVVAREGRVERRVLLLDAAPRGPPVA